MVWRMGYEIYSTREMPADEKSLSPDPDIRAIPVVQSMEGLTLISDWVIGWKDQIRLGLKGIGMTLSLTVIVRLVGHQLLENKFLQSPSKMAFPWLRNSSSGFGEIHIT